ncbi:MAG: orotate phosphoribosyltransferase [Gemmataceae bacterium]|nr:orotate phosphoribosyltransferase [Gemmataceae bacterium]
MSHMSPAESQLLELLKQRSLKIGGPFKLASGEMSDYYIDARTTVICSAGAHLIGEVLFERTQALKLDAIGGLEVGAVPITSAAVVGYHRHGRSMEGFWVRDKVKAHGTQKRIEGGLQPGMRVAIVDDVFTKGQSALKAVEAVREFGCEVVLVLAIVDRLHGARKLFREHGISEYQSVFTIREMGVNVPADSE